MKKVVLSQWYNVNDKNQSGYYLEGVNSEKIYFEGRTKEECEQFALENNLEIAYEA